MLEIVINSHKEEVVMRKILILTLVLGCFLLTACDRGESSPSIDNPTSETVLEEEIITEDVIYEDIIYEDQI